MQFKIGDTFLATPEWLKADGTPGKIDGVPKWENPNPQLFEMTEAEDHLTATGKILAAGTGQIIARGDPDMTPGPGDRDVVATGDIEVREAAPPEPETTRGQINLTKTTPEINPLPASRGRR